MKTNKNSKTAPTREGHLSQSELERAVQNTNTARKYEAAFIIGSFGRVRFLIEAESISEAAHKAEKMRTQLLNHPEACCGAVSIESVKLMNGGQDNE
jgi:hypothetical protein